MSMRQLWGCWWRCGCSCYRWWCCTAFVGWLLHWLHPCDVKCRHLRFRVNPCTHHWHKWKGLILLFIFTHDLKHGDIVSVARTWKITHLTIPVTFGMKRVSTVFTTNTSDLEFPFVCHWFVQVNSAKQSQEPESIPVSDVPRKCPSMSKNLQVLGRLQQGWTAADRLHVVVEVAFALPFVLFLFLFMHNCWLNFCHLLFKHSLTTNSFFHDLVSFVFSFLSQHCFCRSNNFHFVLLPSVWKCSDKQTRAFLITAWLIKTNLNIAIGENVHSKWDPHKGTKIQKLSQLEWCLSKSIPNSNSSMIEEWKNVKELWHHCQFVIPLWSVLHNLETNVLPFIENVNKNGVVKCHHNLRKWRQVARAKTWWSIHSFAQCLTICTVWGKCVKHWFSTLFWVAALFQSLFQICYAFVLSIQHFANHLLQMILQFETFLNWGRVSKSSVKNHCHFQSDWMLQHSVNLLTSFIQQLKTCNTAMMTRTQSRFVFWHCFNECSKIGTILLVVVCLLKLLLVNVWWLPSCWQLKSICFCKSNSSTSSSLWALVKEQCNLLQSFLATKNEQLHCCVSQKFFCISQWETVSCFLSLSSCCVVMTRDHFHFEHLMQHLTFVSCHLVCENQSLTRPRKQCSVFFSKHWTHGRFFQLSSEGEVVCVKWRFLKQSISMLTINLAFDNGQSKEKRKC